MSSSRLPSHADTTPTTAGDPVAGRPTPPGTADTWPGPAAPLAWLTALALTGALLGGLVGLGIGRLSEDEVTVSASIQAVPDNRTLSGPLALFTTTAADSDDFVAAELSWLESQRARLEAASDGLASLAVSQMGTSNVVRISGSAPDADEAKAAVTELLDAYVARRQSDATAAVQAALKAVQARLDAIGPPVTDTGPVARESERLLSQQSELEAAASRVSFVVPVLEAPVVEEPAGAAPDLLHTVLGAVLGAVLLLAGGALWRATSRRLFDARLLIAAGVPVLLPRIPAGPVRRRTDQMPAKAPRAEALAAARLLVAQVVDVSAGPRCLLVVGADERAGAAEVTWHLAWALSSGGSPAAVITTDTTAAADVTAMERTVAPGLIVVSGPAEGSGDALRGILKRHRAAGRLVLLHVPAVSAGLRFTEMAQQADSTVVVVGEGVSSLETSLAAVRDMRTDSASVFAGAVVTTSARHLGAALKKQREPEKRRTRQAHIEVAGAHKPTTTVDAPRTPEPYTRPPLKRPQGVPLRQQDPIPGEV